MRPTAWPSSALKREHRENTMSNNIKPRRSVPWQTIKKMKGTTRMRRERMQKQQLQWDIYENVLTGEIQADGAIVQQELTALKERLRANQQPIPVLLENMIKNTPPNSSHRRGY